MLILFSIIKAVSVILDAVITFFLVVLFVRVVLSWIRVPYNQIVHAIYQITEPALRPVRRRLPLTLGIDFSPMIVWLCLIVIKIVLIDPMFIWAETSIRQYSRF